MEPPGPPVGRRYAAPMSQGWHRVFRGLYRLLRWTDPLIRTGWRQVGIGNIVELTVIGRRSHAPRSVLLGLLRVADRMYLGHPDGEAGWTLDLAAAAEGRLVMHGLPSLEFRPVLLPHGAERDAVISATGQHPFPGNLLYRLGRRHVLATGVYFRLEPAT
jgi:hypothetical protein